MSPERILAPEVAVGAVVRRGDQILVVRRGRGPGTGRWSLPGGRVDFGETLAQAVAREVQEETGVDVDVGEFLGWVERMGTEPAPYHYVILDFAATLPGPPGPLVPGDDAGDARWVPLSEMTTLDLVPGLEAFLRGVGVLPPPTGARG
ncbi:MAG: NUDIX hydrolase [Acidimicrobiia bacterium]